MGTLINVAMIILGGVCGLIFGKKLKPQIQEAIMIANGIAVMILAIGGVMSNMLSIESDVLTQNGTMMMIVSLAAGTLIGELLHIHNGIEMFGEWLKKKTGNQKFNCAIQRALCLS